ncbi:hypothetical protein U9M48_001743, partial [Paspalum notatum var. saurae]
DRAGAFRHPAGAHAPTLSGWKGKNVSAAGRLTLVKSVLTSQVIYVLLALKPPKEVLKSIDSKRKHFLWAGSERLTGGNARLIGPAFCILANSRVPCGLDGCGKHPRSRKGNGWWVTDNHLFAAATSVTVGDGKTASFWESAWLRGLRPRGIYPKVFSISKRKNRSIKEAPSKSTWIQDLNFHHEELSAEHLQEYCQFWAEVNQLNLAANTTGLIHWKLSPNGQYIAYSAYQAQFVGSTCTNYNTIIWKVWAPPKCKFFAWLAVQDRIWTADRLARRRWPHNPCCVLCGMAAETALHLFAECPFFYAHLG